MNLYRKLLWHVSRPAYVRQCLTRLRMALEQNNPETAKAEIAIILQKLPSGDAYRGLNRAIKLLHQKSGITSHFDTLLEIEKFLFAVELKSTGIRKNLVLRRAFKKAVGRIAEFTFREGDISLSQYFGRFMLACEEKSYQPKILICHTITAEQYLNISNCSLTLLLPEKSESTEIPSCVSHKIIPSKSTFQISPAVNLFVIQDASILGSAIVVKERKANDCLANSNGVVESEPIVIGYEPHGVPWLPYVAGHMMHCLGRCGPNQALFSLPGAAGRVVDKAILLAGRVAANYYHFLLEYLSRVELIESQLNMADWPLLVDFRMPKQHFEALRLVFPERAKRLVFYSPQVGVKVKELAIIQPAVSIDDNPKIPPSETINVHRSILHAFRNKVILNLGLTDVLGNRKLYIDRVNKKRQVINNKEVKAFLEKHGFEIVRPEKLSFPEQVKIFREAAIVIGPSGAGLTNLLFGAPGAAAIAFVPPGLETTRIFSELAAVSQMRFLHCVGLPENRKSSLGDSIPPDGLAHQSYYLPLPFLERALETLGIV